MMSLEIINKLYETNKKRKQDDHGTSDGTKCSRAHYPTIFKYMYLELKNEVTL